ncbi:hypothetical protein NE857_13330 [Nocardiopsis exhalans]|uniref:HEAT repeat domain-containing protein n=1 Tax=Nocardiopsis exhalans TaxID=163604 RepID=A0ABY5DEX9_9ACTN|nr:hypothetical protein [Nocardiopsis exhalans]USY22500.1 hypothetical protein NE857_13330 [Nocardiopsis exhalans]
MIEGGRLRALLRPFLDDADPVNRCSTADAVHLVEHDLETVLELIRQRLSVEEDFEVGGTLLVSLGRFASEYPELVDQLVYDAAFGSWREAFDEEGSQVDYGFADGFVVLVLYLALKKRTANALSLAQFWFEEPFESRMCDRAIIKVRRFLTDCDEDVRSAALAVTVQVSRAG